MFDSSINIADEMSILYYYAMINNIEENKFKGVTDFKWKMNETTLEMLKSDMFADDPFSTWGAHLHEPDQPYYFMGGKIVVDNELKLGTIIIE